MKKRNIFHLFLAGVLLSGCSAESEQSAQGGVMPITLGYSVVTATAETRAATNLNNDALTSGSVAVSVKKHTDGTYTTTYNYTAAAGGALSPTTASNQFYYETDGSSSDIIAYYPATASTTFPVQANQTSDDNYKASDLMWAQVTDQLPTNSTVNLEFSHLLTKIIVNATAGTGVSSITSVTLNSVKPKVTFTPADGTVALASSDNAATSITMSNEGAALIPPQTIDGNFITITTNAGTAVYAVENKEFAAGHQYTLNITVNAAAIGATNTITGWTDTASQVVQPTVEVGISLPDRTPAGVNAVDLGLYVGGADSGKKLYWADRNIGATSVMDYGLYFAWGDVLGRSGAVSSGTTAADGYSFSWTNTPYNYGSNIFAATKYNSTDGLTTLEACDDAASMNWGGKWRMPTKAEMEALVTLTNSWISNYNSSGVAGRTFTGNGYTIFLPAAGYRNNTSMKNQGSYGRYWSSSLHTVGPSYAKGLFFHETNAYVSEDFRRNGYMVRPVCEE